jgi:hypothetical protein
MNKSSKNSRNRPGQVALNIIKKTKEKIEAKEVKKTLDAEETPQNHNIHNCLLMPLRSKEEEEKKSNSPFDFVIPTRAPKIFANNPDINQLGLELDNLPPQVQEVLLEKIISGHKDTRLEQDKLYDQFKNESQFMSNNAVSIHKTLTEDIENATKQRSKMKSEIEYVGSRHTVKDWRNAEEENFGKIAVVEYFHAILMSKGYLPTLEVIGSYLCFVCDFTK